MEITRVRAWNDPGFTESGNERPSSSYTLPAADLTSSVSLHPPVGRIFSELRLDDSWLDWRDMSYIELQISWNNEAGTTTIYGFVDSVEILSDTQGAANTSIKWHVDEWFTYLSSATFGSCHILRRPYSGEADTPIQGYERKFWQLDSSTVLYDVYKLSTKRTWWVLLAVGSKNNNMKLVRYYSFPFIIDNTTIYGDIGGIGVSFPFYKDIVAGAWDETLGLDPDNVYGAWILPIPPMDRDDIDDSDPFGTGLTISSTAWSIVQEGPGLSATFISDVSPAYNLLFHTETRNMASKTATQLNPLFVNGFTGEKLLEIPIGMSVGTHTYRVVASATECYIEIRFSDWSSKLIGQCVTVPALVMDMTSNAWSSYQYSGQREYDVTMRANDTLKSGIESVASGAVQGGLIGGVGNMGAGLGAVAGAAGGLVSWGVESLWYNEAAQGAKDKYVSRQASSILISGGAFDAVLHGQDISLCTMEMDSYSEGRASDERSQIGVAVDEFETSFTPTTGFYQITNLIVKGSIPSTAKNLIANTFAKGVRII